ncbi:hypothetical protein [Xanthobacter tagetidis]|uniref:Uncharacterized protein n=1 Tax=Xanthobacter tagetidis TaxID=60216 RepID=A0A3L6ZXU0_9HYPH|nr:hypothetical protein [Xanthobacter tagetidis]MBB6310095.1 hypothetical protein [Xanthobacter tagetidis]RLP72737.1 hypothetical protein D9R14_21420 [Xanthobacter tagetidis]
MDGLGDIGFVAGLAFALVLLAGFLVVRGRGAPAPQQKPDPRATAPADYGLSREASGRSGADTASEAPASNAGAMAAAAGGAVIVGYAASRAHGNSTSARDDAENGDDSGGGSGDGDGDGGGGGEGGGGN